VVPACSKDSADGGAKTRHAALAGSLAPIHFAGAVVREVTMLVATAWASGDL
jgi:hypothetical protein